MNISTFHLVPTCNRITDHSHISWTNMKNSSSNFKDLTVNTSNSSSNFKNLTVNTSKKQNFKIKMAHLSKASLTLARQRSRRIFYRNAQTLLKIGMPKLSSKSKWQKLSKMRLEHNGFSGLWPLSTRKITDFPSCFG